MDGSIPGSSRSSHDTPPRRRCLRVDRRSAAVACGGSTRRARAELAKFSRIVRAEGRRSPILRRRRRRRRRFRRGRLGRLGRLGRRGRRGRRGRSRSARAPSRRGAVATRRPPSRRRRCAAPRPTRPSGSRLPNPSVRTTSRRAAAPGPQAPARSAARDPARSGARGPAREAHGEAEAWDGRLATGGRGLPTLAAMARWNSRVIVGCSGGPRLAPRASRHWHLPGVSEPLSTHLPPLGITHGMAGHATMQPRLSQRFFMAAAAT